MRLTKLILIGFMGSGKSTLAKLIAERIGFTVIDADHEIVKISEYSSISEIIQKSNEAHFRDLESQVAASLQLASSVVIATGGGVIGRAENMRHLTHGGGAVVFLDTSFAEACRRIPDRSSRPLLHDLVTAERLYNERLAVYQHYADFTVITDTKTLEMICSEIITWLNTHYEL